MPRFHSCDVKMFLRTWPAALHRETQEPCHLWKKISLHGRKLGRAQEGLCELQSLLLS